MSPEEMKDKIEKLQAFKDWVHSFLDEQGVPGDPYPEETVISGCRIGCRLRYVFEDLYDAKAEVKRLEEHIDNSWRE